MVIFSKTVSPSGSADPESPGFFTELSNQVIDYILSTLFKGVVRTTSLLARIGAIASGMVSFFSGIALARTVVKYTKGPSKFLLYIQPISSLLTICLDIYSVLFDTGLLEGVKQKFSDAIECIKTNISTVVSTLLETIQSIPLLGGRDPNVIELCNTLGDGGDKVMSNALSPTQTIGLATSLFTLILVSGASLIGWKITEINQFLRLRSQSFSAAKDLKAGIIETLEALGIADVTGQTAIVKDVEEIIETCHELRKCELQDLVLDTTKFKSLVKVLVSIKDIQKRALHEEIRKALSQHLRKLDSEYQILFATYNKVASLLSDVDRQNCVGVLLEGDAGIGKSHFSKFLLRELAKRFGYSTEIYDMSRGSSHRFAGGYAYQSLGIFNEFGAQRSEKLDYLEEVNKILSSDPFGFESAPADMKYQPCKLKVCVFTSNMNRYDFSKNMTEPANIALMSRFIRVQIRDVNYKPDRNDPQAHRKADYSHLECQIVRPLNQKAISKLSDCWNLQAARLTPMQLIDHLTPIIAHHELNHISLVQEKAHGDEALTTGLNNRVEQLEKLVSDTQSPNLQFSNNYENFHGTSGTGSLRTRVFTPSAKPNASEPLVFHFAGPPGVGKTLSANNIADRLSRLYGLEVFKFKQQLPTPTAWASIYIIDDYPFEDPAKAQEYLNFINSLHENSITIITTNHPFALYQKKWYSSTFTNKIFCWWYDIPYSSVPLLDPDSYWARVYKAVPGLVRRTGLPFAYEEVGYVPRTTQCYAEFNAIGLPVITSPDPECNVVVNTCNVYTKFLRTSHTVHVVEQEPPPCEVDVTLDIKDFPKCIELMSSQVGLFKLCKGTDAGKISFNPETTARKASSCSVSDWVLPRIDPNTALLDGVLAYAMRIRLICPAINFVFNFKEKKFCYTSGVLYVSAQETYNPIVIIDGMIHLHSQPFVPSAFAVFMHSPLNYIQIDKRFTFIDLEYARQYYKDNSEHLPLYREAVKHYGKSTSWTHKFSQAISFINSKIGTALIRFIFLIVCVLGIYSLVKKFFAKPVREVLANGSLNPSCSTDLSSEYSGGMTGAELARWREELQQRIEGQVIKKNWRARPSGVDPEHGDVLRTALVATTECTNPLIAYNDLIDTFPPELRASFATSNAVTPELENFVQETAFSSAVLRIKRNFFKFCGKQNCYGIFLKKNLACVPLHAVDLKNPEGNSIHWSSTAQGVPQAFSVEIVAYTSVKDVCLVKALGAPPMKDITSLLPQGVLKTYTVTACFVRPVANTEMCWGTAYYNPTKCLPLSDQAQFHPYDYVHFDQVSFGARAIYQRGDCGMPLLGMVENKVILLGFHIALNGNQEGWFSPLCAEDLEHLGEVLPNAVAPKSVVPGFEKCVDIPSWNDVLSNVKDKNPISTHPEVKVLGTYPTHFSVTPKPDKMKVHFDDPQRPLNFPLSTGPAPTRPKMLCEAAKEVLPKLDDGTPSPLLAQTKKYYAGLPFNPDKKMFELAVFFEKHLFQSYFGTNNKLLRTHEVINGILGSSLKHLTMDSSAGPYMKFKHGIHQKEPLFVLNKADPPVYGFNLRTDAGNELYQQYKDICECWSSGQPTALVIKDNPKVEILGIEDLEVGKLRLFCELDLAVNMALRRYFGSVFNKMAESSYQSPWKIAWNPYSFPHYICETENPDYDLICIDVKRMDKNLNKVFVQTLCDLVDSCMEEPCPTDFKAISETMSQAVHIQGDLVYTQEDGNHSGSYLTTPLNTTTLHIGGNYAFCKRYKEIKGIPPSLDDTKYFSSALVGDDGRLRFHKSLGMTFEYLAECFRELGLEIVENKNTKGDAELGELCSRTFLRTEDGLTVIGALKKRSILKMIHWCKRSRLHLLPQIASLAIFEASFWEKDFFEKVIADSIRILQKHGMDGRQLKISTYESYREHLALYCRGQVDSPVVTSTGNDIFNVYTPDRPPVAFYAEYTVEYHNRFPDSLRTAREASQFIKESSHWRVTITHQGFTGVGHAPTYQAARGSAYKELCSQRLPGFSPASDSQKA